MSVYEAVTPTGLAARLAEYISDPSTIRVRVLEHYGRAPSVEKCRNLRQAALDRRKAERDEMLNRLIDKKIGPILGCGHPNIDENITFDGPRTVCLTCEQKRVADARKRWAMKLRVQAVEMRGDLHHRPDKAVILSPAQRVIRTAIREFQVPREAIYGRSRARPVCRARQAIAFVLREADPFKYTTPRLAGFIGVIDHASVIHSIKVATGFMQTDPQFAERVEKMRAAYAESIPKVDEELVEALVRRAA